MKTFPITRLKNLLRYSVLALSAALIPILGVNTSFAKNVTGTETEMKKDPCAKTGTASLRYVLEFNQSIYPELGGRALMIHKAKPSPELFDVGALYYEGAMAIWAEVGDTHLRIRSVDDDGQRESTSGDGLFIELANMVEIAPYKWGTDPFYMYSEMPRNITEGYISYEETGRRQVFNMKTGELVLYEGKNGLIDTRNLPEEAKTHIIRDSFRKLRQIKNPQGLADIQRLPDETGFVIRLYTYEQVSQTRDRKEIDPRMWNPVQYPYGGDIFSASGAPYREIRFENPQAAAKKYNVMRITDTWGPDVKTMVFTYSESLEDWTLDKQDGASRETKVLISQDTKAKTRTYERTLTDGSGNQVSKQRFTELQGKDDEWVTISETQDPDGANLTTQYEYRYVLDKGRSDEHYNRELASQINPDGSWVKYLTGEDGSKREVRPWLDSPFDSPESTCWVKKTTEHVNRTPYLTEEVEYIQGQEVSRTYKQEPVGLGLDLVIRREQAIRAGAAYNTAGNLVEEKGYLFAKRLGSGGWSSKELVLGRPSYIKHADGRQTSYGYAYENLDPDHYFVTMETEGTVDNPAGVPGKSTERRIFKNTRGQVTLIMTLACLDSGNYATISTENYFYNPYGQLEQKLKNDRVVYNATYVADKKVSDTDEVGITRTYTYDELGRLLTETKQGTGSGHPNIVTQYNRTLGGLECGCDANVEVTVTGGGFSLKTSMKKDQYGRITEEIDEAGLVTTYAYTNGGRTKTTVLPNTATRIEEHYLDGRLKSITGTGVVAQYYTYGANGDNTQWSKVTQVAPNGPRWSKTTTDFLGRTWKDERPGFGDGAIVTKTLEYNNKGRLSKQSSSATGGNPLLLYQDVYYAYDALGNLIDAASGSVWQEHTQRYVVENGACFLVKEEATTYQDPDTNEYITTKTGVTKQRLTGFAPDVVAYVENYAPPFDEQGNSVNKTTRTTALYRNTQAVVTTTTLPTSTQPLVETRVGGRLMSSISPSHGGETLYRYDGLGRESERKEARHEAYSTTKYNSKGQLDSETDAAGNKTSYVYYANGTLGAGQLRQETNALGHTTFHQYDAQDREIYTWGSAVYPIAQGYDAYGQRNLLRTFRDNSINFNGTSFPGSASGDTTSWVYDEATGALLQKLYADGKGPRYDYYTQGQLYSRTWARTDAQGQPLVTSYNYTYQSQLAEINYSDDTPNVFYSYNPLGQATSITDGTGTRTFTYGAENLQLKTETYSEPYATTLQRSYDSFGRPLTVSTDSHAVRYGYGTSGRLEHVESVAPTSLDGPAQDTYSYGYIAQSNLLETVGSPVHTVTNAYEPNREILTTKENKTTSGAVVSRYEYNVNALGQRTSRAQSGSAFNGTSADTFGYNPRGELIDSANNQNAELNRDYNYDPIGNRLRTTEPELTRSYLTNHLNQYTTVVAVPAVVTNLTYDLDGNMLTDGTGKRYTWDCENRLIQVTLPNNEIVRYSYDGGGRRIKREQINGTNTEATTYLCDGWNVIEEREFNNIDLNSEPLKLKTYVWGLDLSSRLQGAGGVVGLLSVQIITPDFSPSTRYYYAYDANGNVSELLDSTGAITAHYTYDAFGKVTTASGPESQRNTYRFSTKPWDSKTELNYYGYRFYQPKDGRWINRDPIEEWGGVGLYQFNANRAINIIDPWGMSGLTVTGCSTGSLVNVESEFYKAKEKIKQIISSAENVFKLGTDVTSKLEKLELYQKLNQRNQQNIINVIRFNYHKKAEDLINKLKEMLVAFDEDLSIECICCSDEKNKSKYGLPDETDSLIAFVRNKGPFDFGKRERKIYFCIENEAEAAKRGIANAIGHELSHIYLNTYDDPVANKSLEFGNAYYIEKLFANPDQFEREVIIELTIIMQKYLAEQGVDLN